MKEKGLLLLMGVGIGTVALVAIYVVKAIFPR